MTDLLYAMPSILYGLARLFDLSGTFDTYNEMATPREADAAALYSDFRAVAGDLETAMAEAEPELISADHDRS